MICSLRPRRRGAAVVPCRDGITGEAGAIPALSRNGQSPNAHLERTTPPCASQGRGWQRKSTGRAVQFYDVLSSRRFVNSMPTLFNSGTLHPQLSSCYLTTIGDDLGQIFKCIRDNALLSKWAGGIGNDWTPVRAMGSFIEGTGGRSQGVVPFLKAANDTAVAVNQGGSARVRSAPTWRRGTSHRGVSGTAQEHRRRAPPNA